MWNPSPSSFARTSSVLSLMTISWLLGIASSDPLTASKDCAHWRFTSSEATASAIDSLNPVRMSLRPSRIGVIIAAVARIVPPALCHPSTKSSTSWVTSIRLRPTSPHMPGTFDNTLPVRLPAFIKPSRAVPMVYASPSDSIAAVCSHTWAIPIMLSPTAIAVSPT